MGVRRRKVDEELKEKGEGRRRVKEGRWKRERGVPLFLCFFLIIILMIIILIIINDNLYNNNNKNNNNLDDNYNINKNNNSLDKKNSGNISTFIKRNTSPLVNYGILFDYNSLSWIIKYIPWLLWVIMEGVEGKWDMCLKDKFSLQIIHPNVL